MEQRDAGLLGITTKHLYFKGSHTSFRVRLEKIVSFEPFRDGLGIMRDSARAKPELFTMGTTDVWFSVNLINALLAIEELELPGPRLPDARSHRERGSRRADLTTTRAREALGLSQPTGTGSCLPPAPPSILWIPPPFPVRPTCLPLRMSFDTVLLNSHRSRTCSPQLGISSP